MTKHFEKIFVPVLFCIYLLTGVFIHSDYGVSWDEPISRTNGLVNLKYVEGKFSPGLLTDAIRDAPDLDRWQDRDYGVAFELPLVALEQAFGVSEEHTYAFRHLAIFLFASLGVLAIYKTARFVYGDYRLGLLAALMIILSPRIFAESFYNSKDIVFMAAMSMAIYTLTRLVTTARFTVALLHAAISAFAIDVRIMGIVIVGATVPILVVRAIKKETSWARVVACVLIYLVATALFVIALFPYLWDDPIGHFMEAFANMARFRWNGWVLYLGTAYRAPGLPWHYVPVWIFITTPLAFSALMVMGLIHGVRILWKNGLSLWTSDVQMAELSYLSLLFGPVLAILAVHAVVYDGWRHLYFVYPAFVLVAVGGFVALMRRARHARLSQWALLGAVGMTFCANAYWIVRSHPLQNVYFNALAGRHWKDKFDLDYWGLGNRAALESVLAGASSQVIAIKPISQTPLDRALLSMPHDDRERFLFSAPESKPEFILTNYRFDSLCEGRCDLGDYDLYYQKKVGGEKIVSVYRIRNAALSDKITRAEREYSADEFRQLSFHITGRYRREKQTYVDVKIENAGPGSIAAESSVGKPVRVSWRFVDARGVPRSGWNTRRALPHDIPSHGQVTVSIPIEASKEVEGGSLQVSMLQEQVFWAHDLGVPPATLAWTAIDQ